MNRRPWAWPSAAGAAEPHILSRVARPVGADLMSHDLPIGVVDGNQNARRSAHRQIGSGLLAQQEPRHIQHHAPVQVIKNLGQARAQQPVPLPPALIPASLNGLQRELTFLGQVLLVVGAEGQVAVQRPIDLVQGGGRRQTLTAGLGKVRENRPVELRFVKRVPPTAETTLRR